MSGERKTLYMEIEEVSDWSGRAINEAAQYKPVGDFIYTPRHARQPVLQQRWSSHCSRI